MTVWLAQRMNIYVKVAALILSIPVLGHSGRNLCPYSELGHTLTPAMAHLPGRDPKRFREPWTPRLQVLMAITDYLVHKDLKPLGPHC